MTAYTIKAHNTMVLPHKQTKWDEQFSPHPTTKKPINHLKEITTDVTTNDTSFSKVKVEPQSKFETLKNNLKSQKFVTISFPRNKVSL